MPAENENLEEQRQENFLKAYNDGKSHVAGEAYWDEPDFTIFDVLDMEDEHEYPWVCDTFHQYAIGTSQKNADENDLRLWKNDIIFGFQASDTSGWWSADLGTSMHYSSNHKVRIDIYHTDSKGRVDKVVSNYDLMGGDADNGIRYLPFYPSKIGKYTVWINRVLSAGGCGVPMEGTNNFWKYEIEIKPPAEGDEIPDGINVDYDALREEFEQYQLNMALMGGETVSPITPLALLGTGIAVSLIAYGIFSLFK